LKLKFSEHVPEGKVLITPENYLYANPFFLALDSFEELFHSKNVQGIIIEVSPINKGRIEKWLLRHK